MVNIKIQDNPLGKLMRDFMCIAASKIYYDKLVDRVEYFKETYEDSSAMSKMMKNMRIDAVINTVIAMLKDSIPLEKVAQYSGLSFDEVKKIKKDNNL